MSVFLRLRAAYGRLLYACGLVSGLTVFFMMLLVVANVIGRFLFNTPINGTLEITESMLTVLIFLALGLTQYEGGHIHVVLLLKRFTPFWHRVAETAAMALGAVFFAWSSWASWNFAMKSLAMDEHEWGSIQFPLYPVKLVLFAGLVLLTLQFVLDTILSASGHQPPEQAQHISPEGEAV
ncbi:TRAP transporter small permease subunit [Radicibacter daui]|uniref:TRAP transporter small permease subunit n=1 Tax=Radicibacter daui TaxID=3064829 RepID=UPI004046BBA1